MTMQLDQDRVDQAATVVIIEGDQLLLVSAEAVGSISHAELLPPEYQSIAGRVGAPTIDPRPRLPRTRRVAGSGGEAETQSDVGQETRRRTVAAAVSPGIALDGAARPEGGGAAADGWPSADEHRRFTERRESIAIDERGRRRRRRSRLVFGGVALIGVVSVIGTSPVLRVQEVDIVGLNALSRGAILDSMAVGDRPSMLTLKVGDVEDRLTALPLIHSAKVWKEWPNRLVVHVAERSPVATIRSNGGWLVLDQHGGVLETRTVRPDLPLLDLGGQEVTEGSKDITALLNVASAASARLRQQIDTLSLQDGGVTVRMRAGAISAADVAVRIGHADDVEAKLRALETMADESTAVSFDGIATLDLTVADQPALIPRSVPEAVEPIAGAPETAADGGPESVRPATGTSPATD